MVKLYRAWTDTNVELAWSSEYVELNYHIVHHVVLVQPAEIDLYDNIELEAFTHWRKTLPLLAGWQVSDCLQLQYEYLATQFSYSPLISDTLCLQPF